MSRRIVHEHEPRLRINPGFHSPRLRASALTLVFLLHCGGCAAKRYDPALASRPYPYDLHTTETIDIQVFREDTDLVITNTTVQTFRDFDLWINQRWVRHVDALPPGATIRLSLWEFYDERGETPNAGGFFRSKPPTPVRLVEIQPEPDQPTIGLIAIRAEEVRLRQPRR